MPFIAMLFGGALRRFFDALKWCAERPAIAVAVVSLVVAGFFYVKANHLSEKLENARSEITQLINERKEAIRYAEAEKARLEKKNKEAKNEADKTLRIALADADARLRQYARTHSAKAHLSGASASPQEPDGPDPEAIVVTFGDARACSVAVARLENAQQWANDTYGEVK